MHNFKRYAKGEWSQLVFMFDETNDTSKYPHGVKMSYRAFSAEHVVSIVRDPKHWSCLSIENRYIPTYPLDTEPEGLYILKSLPTCNVIFEPDEFVEGGRRKLEEVKRSIDRNYNGQRWILDEWQEFYDQCPTSDDAWTYVVDNKDAYKIPLFEKLFLGKQNEATDALLSATATSASDVLPLTGAVNIGLRTTAGICCGSQKRRKNIPQRPVELYNLQTGKAIDVPTNRTNAKKSRKKQKVQADACLTDYEGDSEWIRLKSKGKHHNDRMGDPVMCIDSTFVISKDHYKKFPFHDILRVGKISGVLLERRTKDKYFEFYNLEKYPENPPPLGSTDYLRHLVHKMQTTNEKLSGIHWTVKDTPKEPVRRRKRNTYAYLDKNGNVIEANEDGTYIDGEGNVIDSNGSYLVKDPRNDDNDMIELSDVDDDDNTSSDDDYQPRPRRRSSSAKAVLDYDGSDNDDESALSGSEYNDNNEDLNDNDDESASSGSEYNDNNKDLNYWRYSDSEVGDLDSSTTTNSLFNSFNSSKNPKGASKNKSSSGKNSAYCSSNGGNNTSKNKTVGAAILNTSVIRNKIINDIAASSSSVSSARMHKKSSIKKRSEELQNQIRKRRERII
ncbi:MAG: hypothetical protein ACOVRN_11945 [Flavobacterium sp.]